GAELAAVPRAVADGATEAVVADRSEDLVVEAVAQVARRAMRIGARPAVRENRAPVGLAVAVGVLEKEDLRRLRDDDAAAYQHQAGGEVQPVSEDLRVVGA